MKFTLAAFYLAQMLIFLCMPPAQAASSAIFSPCQILDAYAVSESTSSEGFKSWSIAARDIELSVEQLLPRFYLEQITNKHESKPELHVTTTPDLVALHIRVNQIDGESKTILNAKLLRHEQSGVMVVENLTLADPLNEQSPSFEQRQKGLPPSVFRYLKLRVIELARAGGFHTMQSSGQNSFLVAALYEKLVGMTPADPKSQKLRDHLHNMYRLIRKNYPELLSHKSPEAFAAILGGVHTKPAALTPRRQQLYEEYRQTGTLAEGMSVITDVNGEQVAVVFPPASGYPVRLVLIDIFNLDRPILTWQKIAREKRLRLQKFISPGDVNPDH